MAPAFRNRLFQWEGKMFDATKLLGTFLESRSTASMPERLGSAVRQDSQSGGMLEQVMSQFGGAASGGGLGALLGSALGSGTAPNQIAGAGSGGFMGNL